jgi:hypothetical protein
VFINLDYVKMDNGLILLLMIIFLAMCRMDQYLVITSKMVLLNFDTKVFVVNKKIKTYFLDEI